ncbi:hypothetical protein LIER_08362 [Lithospermum erythrorhizon]
MADMIKFVANEPSVGLFYIQQHAHSAGPNIINLGKRITEKSHEITWHTEDSDDSITTIRSMKECGFPIADEMISDIRNTLGIVSSKQPKQGLITSSSWTPSIWTRNTGYRQQEDVSNSVSSNNIFSVFRPAKQKSSSLKRSQSKQTAPIQIKDKGVLPDSLLSAASAPSFATINDMEDEEVPLPSQLANSTQDELSIRRSFSHKELLSLSDNFEDFKADREAKLEKWLDGADMDDHRRARIQK